MKILQDICLQQLGTFLHYVQIDFFYIKCQLKTFSALKKIMKLESEVL